MEDAVTQLVGVLLCPPLSEGMGRRGDRSQSVTAGDFRHRATQIGEFGARSLDRFAHGSADLELSAQEFSTETSAQVRLEFVDQRLRRLADQIPGVQVDEQVFLFDANRETWFVDCHQ